MGALIDQMAMAGLPVELVVEGHHQALPEAIELTIYQIIQEALTNTLRHAGPTEAEITLRYTPQEVTVRITDRGREVSAGPANGRPIGHRLLGMRERVGLYAGALHTDRRWWV